MHIMQQKKKKCFNVLRSLCRVDTFRRQSETYAPNSMRHSIIITAIMAPIGMVDSACIVCTCHTAVSAGADADVRFTTSIPSAVGHSGHPAMRSASNGESATAR